MSREGSALAQRTMKTVRYEMGGVAIGWAEVVVVRKAIHSARESARSAPIISGMMMAAKCQRETAANAVHSCAVGIGDSTYQRMAIAMTHGF